MGYSEVPCKLCGVSFNIGRVRRPDEPYRAGWSPTCGEPAALPEGWNRGRHWENYISKDFVKWRRCDPSTGCLDSEREVASAERARKASGDSGSDYGDDEDYLYESEEDDEPLEYISEVASVEELDAGDADESASETDDSFSIQLGTALEKDGKSFNEGGSSLTNEMNDESKSGMEHQQSRLSLDGSNYSPPVAEAKNASESDSFEATDWNKCQELEHLAGPRCKHSSGYCGFNISVEEMKGCTTVQCLVVKTQEWTPETDDQKFELSGKYFLSGLCGQMPSRDIGGPTMTPPRHGAKDLYADVVFWNNGEPCHSTQPALKYLHVSPASAQPASMLSVVLRSAVKERNISPKDDAKGRPGLEDPFSRFPREIADAILDLLSPVEVAALRLAGYARFLAIESWYRVLREDMPWLWEVWDTILPSFWATTTVSALSAEKKRKEDVERQWLAARSVIQQEMPEIIEIWEMENPKEADRSYAVCGNEGLKETPVLPKNETNWCRVYYEVKMNWDSLKGLQNRERVWKDVEEIFRRIDVYRGEGRIA